MSNMLGMLGSILTVIGTVIGLYRQRKLRRQNWEGTVVGRAGSKIWILVPSDLVHSVTAVLPKPFRKTIKIGDAITKRAGVLEVEVTPRKLEEVENNLRKRITEAARNIEPVVVSSKSRAVKTLIAMTAIGPLILGSTAALHYRSYGMMLMPIMMAVMIVLFLGFMVWAILRVRKQ